MNLDAILRRIRRKPSSKKPLETAPTESIPELEALLVLVPPGETEALMRARGYLSEHDNLVGCQEVKDYQESRIALADSAFAAVKKTILLESMPYLCNAITRLQQEEAAEMSEQPYVTITQGIYTRDLPPSRIHVRDLPHMPSHERNTLIDDCRRRLLSSSVHDDYRALYATAKSAFSLIGNHEYFPLDGKFDDEYVIDIGHLLDFLDPDKTLGVTRNISGGDISFQNSSIKFCISDDKYADPNRRLEGFDHIFKPVLLYLCVRSVNAPFAETLCKELVKKNVTIEPSEIALASRTDPFVHFRGIFYK